MTQNMLRLKSPGVGGLIADTVKATEDATSFLNRLTDKDIEACDEAKRNQLSKALALFIQSMLRLDFVRKELAKQRPK